MIGPEAKRAIAFGILRATLDREPTPEELSSVLRATIDETEAGRFAEAIVRRVPRPTPPVLLELARSAVMLEAELVAIRSSLSWKLSGALRFGGRRLPQSVQHTIRAAAIRAYRGARAGVALARNNADRLPLLGRGGTAVPQPGAPPVDAALARARAAQWCGTAETPTVSFIIINWNAAALTEHCIRHLWQVNEGVSYEILVADNGSAPREAAILARLGPGVRVLPLGVNRYFGEANNIAAEQARGEFLCFLNNDAFPRPGWLTPLLDALRSDPAAGAAGPKFLFPDGKLQEAGAVIGAEGYPMRFGRLVEAPAGTFDRPLEVDYISAAALLIPKALFEAVGGFDLAFEPAYYEDTDLCFRLRLLGRTVRYCPASEVVHLEGATGDDAARAAYRTALGNFNRGKFVARWGDYLRERDPAFLEALRPGLIPSHGTARVSAPPVDALPQAGIFTPYALTPGGGERYILTLASVLAGQFAVTLYTPFTYSRFRLDALERIFGIDLKACRLATYDPDHPPRPDLWIAMGNHIVPSVPGHGRENWYHCQFPFPIEAKQMEKERDHLRSYQRLLVNSRYTQRHVEQSFAAAALTALPVHVVYPPVPMLDGDPARKGHTILSVGRFFAGGHTKRQDVMLDALRELLRRVDSPVTLHLAGSSSPERPNMDYLTQLQAAAAGLPVTFHLNAPAETLRALYAQAPLYWHAAGYGMAEDEPEKAEHFGISIVEAMSAGCVPVAYKAGGPTEIIEEGVSGFLFDTLDTLVETSAALLARDGRSRREAIARSAAARAQGYAESMFAAAIEDLVKETASPGAP